MLILVLLIIFAIIGAIMASGRNRNPFVWGFICFFTGIIGIIILAVIGADNSA